MRTFIRTCSVEIRYLHWERAVVMEEERFLFSLSRPSQSSYAWSRTANDAVLRTQFRSTYFQILGFQVFITPEVAQTYLVFSFQSLWNASNLKSFRPHLSDIADTRTGLWQPCKLTRCFGWAKIKLTAIVWLVTLQLLATNQRATHRFVDSLSAQIRSVRVRISPIDM